MTLFQRCLTNKFAMQSQRWVLNLALVLLLSACNSLPDKQQIPLAQTEHTIYFIYRDWHTSILLDAESVARYSKHLHSEAVGQQFVRVGWGDGDYFTGKSKTMGAATKALLASDYSALQVLTYSSSPFVQIPPETRVPLRISRQGLRALIRYIDNSLVLDEQGQLISLPAYGEGVGRFYQSSGNYGLFHNCNTWSGRALQAARLPVRSQLKLTAQSVFEQAKFISDYQQAQGILSGERAHQAD